MNRYLPLVMYVLSAAMFIYATINYILYEEYFFAVIFGVLSLVSVCAPFLRHDDNDDE